MSGLDPGEYLGTERISHRMWPKELAILFIGWYGGIDGSHHKARVLAQVARILHGTEVAAYKKTWERHEEIYYETLEPSQEYLDWVEEMRGDYDEEYEEYEYGYDEGIAP